MESISFSIWTTFLINEQWVDCIGNDPFLLKLCTWNKMQRFAATSTQRGTKQIRDGGLEVKNPGAEFSRTFIYFFKISD